MLALQNQVGSCALLDTIAAGLNPLEVFPHGGALRRHLGQALPGEAVVDPSGCGDRGVEAFTDGLTTHFRTATPAIAVAAHEAAHQLQHADLTRDAGLGPEGHAEAIAHRVVAGQPAQDLIGAEGAAVAGEVHPYLMIPVDQQGPASDLGWTAPQADGLRVSDDGHLAVPDVTDTVSKLAWATAEDINAANATLEAQGSAVALKAGPAELSGKAPNGYGAGPQILLSRVIATAAGGPRQVRLTADCGKAAYEVMGGADDGDLGAAVVQTPQGERTTDPHPYQSRNEDLPGAVGTTELWFREILRMAYGDLPVEELVALYQGQSPEERAAFEARWGINMQAVPEVGEAVTTMSLQDAPDWHPTSEDGFFWNWHFGACVLKSGADYITMENYTGSQPESWYFSMFGPAQYNQSFDNQEGATNSFGTDHVSMVVRPESRMHLDLSLTQDADLFGSSELYVRLTTPLGTRTSEVVSVQTGSLGAVDVSLASLIANGESEPIQIELFDQDLLSDEHLLTVTWAPPFGPARYTENGVTIAGEMIR